MLYQKIAKNIEEDIRKGVLKAGDRLPSVRKMSRHQRVSVTTVLEAYMLLEKRGFIEPKPQSGFYVRVSSNFAAPEPEMRAMSPVTTPVRVNDLVYEMVQTARNPAIVPLGASGPSSILFPHDKLNVIFRSIIRSHPNHSGSYDYPPGSEELRRQIARRAMEAGCHLGITDLSITSGAMEAVTLSLRAVARPGDAVAVESPTHYCILQTIESLNMKALEVPTHPRHGIDIEAIESSLKKYNVRTGIFMPNFNNPLGSLMPDENKKALVALFARKKLPIIEDDIEGDLPHFNERPKPLKAFDQDGIVLWCSSFSKTVSPGLRIGWVAPGRFQERIEKLKFMSSMASPSLNEMVIAEYLKTGGYERHLRRIRQAYASQTARIRQSISIYFPENTKVTRPEGGFVLWIEFPKNLDASKLYRQALDRNISVSPGILFSPSKRYQNCIRINCGVPWSERIEKALLELGELAKRQIKF